MSEKKWLVMLHANFKGKYAAQKFMDELRDAFDEDEADIKLTLIEEEECLIRRL